MLPKKGKDIPEYFGEKVHIGNISLDLSLIDLTLFILLFNIFKLHKILHCVYLFKYLTYVKVDA